MKYVNVLILAHSINQVLSKITSHMLLTSSVTSPALSARKILRTCSHTLSDVYKCSNQTVSISIVLHENAKPMQFKHIYLQVYPSYKKAK